MKIGAIVLAAGGASRMGQPKQLLVYKGKPLVCRAVWAVLQAGCHPVVVVTGAAVEGVATAVKDLPVQTHFNADWSAGMGSSLRVGLEKAIQLDPEIDAVLVLPCDQPLVDSRVISALVERFASAGMPIAACAYSDIVGTPCCFHRSTFADLQSLPAASGAKLLLNRLPEKLATFDWPGGAFDLDTPDDWQRFCQKDADR